MKRQTRKLMLNIATGVAVATVAAVVFLPAVQAAPGQVTGNVNVRSGPGASYQVIDTLQRGANVDIRQCQGNYCEIRTRGTSGWVAASYLNKAGGNFGPGPGNFGPGQGNGGIGITIGPNGINIGGGNNNNPPPIADNNDDSEVCFYDRTSYRGQSTCVGQGESVRNLGSLSERISSIDNPDGLRVEVCGDNRDCRTYTSSARSLGDFDDYIISVRVR